MATVLHLFTDAPDDLALATLHQHVAAADAVTVVLLEGAGGGPSLPGVTVQRVPADVSYARLLERIFAADQVIAW
jgi:hypothetical protein